MIQTFQAIRSKRTFLSSHSPSPGNSTDTFPKESSKYLNHNPQKSTRYQPNRSSMRSQLNPFSLPIALPPSKSLHKESLLAAQSTYPLGDSETERSSMSMRVGDLKRYRNLVWLWMGIFRYRPCVRASACQVFIHGVLFFFISRFHFFWGEDL